MPHRSNFLDFAFRKAESIRGRSEEHRIFTHQISTEGEDIIGL